MPAWLRWREPPIRGMPHGYRLAASPWVPWFDRVAGALESPLARQLFRRAPDRPIFIVGAFRSGTTLVERLLCAHPDVASFCYFSNQFVRAPLIAAAGIRALARLGVLDLTPTGFIHNPKLPSNLFSSFECEWIYSLCGRSIWDHGGRAVALDRAYRNPAFERHLRSLVQRHLWLFGRHRFVNKNPFNSLRMGFLARVFPDAHFVRVLRHPLATVDSHLRTQRALEEALLSQPSGERVYRTGLHMDVLSLCVPDDATPRSAATCADARRLAIARQWCALQDAIDDAVAADSAMAGRVHTVRYEELLASPRECIGALFNAVGLDCEAHGQSPSHASVAIQPDAVDIASIVRSLGDAYPALRDLLEASSARCAYELPAAATGR